MKLILVRHGESIGNFENRLQGQADYDLTDLGRKQAMLTAERLHRLGTSAVYSSHLLRAKATGEALAEKLAVPLVVSEEVAEYHFGEMSGITYAEIREKFGAIANPAERVYPGEEGRDAFFARVTGALLGIASAHRKENVAVVSHGGPIALFCQHVLGLPYKRPMPFSIDNCSLSVIEVTGSDSPALSLVRLNDTCHLRGVAAGD
jgi:broad specificity phosphatase PhoE